MPKTKHMEHGEIRKPVSLGLTPGAVKGLDSQAKQLGISRSDLVERIGRGEISLTGPEATLLGE